MRQIGEERLDGWKEIASYLGKDQRTAQRWERERGLPVHHTPGKKRGVVYAEPSMIDAWLARRTDENLTATGRRRGVERPSSRRDYDRSPFLEITWQRASSRFGLAATGITAVVIMIFVWLAKVGHPAAALLPPRVTSYLPLTNDGYSKRNIRFGGSRVCFNEILNNHEVVAFIPSTGGAIRRIAMASEDSLLLDVSRDGRRALVAAVDGTEYDHPVWNVSLDGGSLIRVGTILAHAAVWSPDGGRFVFAKGTSIFTTMPDEADTVKLAETDGEVDNLRWSPDGTKIRFAVRDRGTSIWSAWQIPISNSELGPQREAQVLSLPRECCVTWGWFEGGNYFLSGIRKSEVELSLWLRSEVRNGLYDGKPVTLPAGSPKVTDFATDERGMDLFALGTGPKAAELLRLDPNTKKFSMYLPGVSSHFVAFSTDSESVAYVAVGDRSLWRSQSDGTQASELVSTDFEDIELPRWSPDDRRIAFVGKKPHRPWRVYVVASTGGNPREAAIGSDDQGAPTWSPDGRTLAYANVKCQHDDSCAVHLIDLATREVSTLPHSQGLRTARWAPNGRYMAALDPEQHRLVVYDFRTQRWTALANEVTGDDVSWSRDSRFIYFNNPKSERPVVNRVQLSKHKVENVAALNMFGQTFGSFDIWFELAPDNTLIFAHTVQPYEVYALDWK